MGIVPFQGAECPARRSGGGEVEAAATGKRARVKHLALLCGLAALFLLSAACSSEGLQSTFDPAGPVAQRQLTLFNVLLWVMVAIFVLVEGALLYAIIRYRRRPGQGLPPQVHGNTPLEVTWTIIPTVLILALGVWSVVTLFELDQPPTGSDPLRVEVTGHQWWWEFEYPDADGEGTVITTANQLRIPVDRAVTFDLSSDDVIHSFWVPKLAGKTDVIPTRNNRLWFEAQETGVFLGQCAEFCGIAHAQMKFLVEVLTQEEYDRWVENYGATEQASPQAQQGQQVFAANCSVCHTASGPDNPGVVQGRVSGFREGAPIAPGPNLTDLATRDTIGAGLIEMGAENLRAWIRNPDQIKPGNYMAERAAIYQDGNLTLSDEELDAVVEYLLTLK